MKKDITGKDLIKMLGYEKIKPISLPSSIQKDVDEGNNYYGEWFEEALLKDYEEFLSN